MEVGKEEWKVLNKALDEWDRQGMLAPGQADELKKSVRLKKTERQQIAQYFFIIAISCTILAFGAIFIDEKLLERIKVYFALSNIFIAFVSAAIAIAWFWYVYKRKDKLSNAAYEIYMVLGALSVLTSLVYIFKDVGFGPSHSSFLMTAAISLFILSVILRSRSLWLTGILALTGWYGAFCTAYEQKNLFLGMNYPMRFTVFGGIITALSLLQLRSARLAFPQRLSYIAGLIIFFTGLWGISVFGNYGYLEEWQKVRQSQVLGYAFVFAFFSFIAFYLGIKRKDDFTRDIGILFILINLYSRYFEYFWDNTNKGIFFSILAFSFWFIGRYLDKRKKAI
jgi:hypothetical protein